MKKYLMPGLTACLAFLIAFLVQWVATRTAQAAALPVVDPCTVGCYSVELVSAVDNGNGTTTLTWQITNNCDYGLSHVSFRLPSKMVAIEPAHESIYTAPSGRQYEVENPTNNPFYAIKFNTTGSEGIKNGASDLFIYTIPGSFDPDAIMEVEMKAGTNQRTLEFYPSGCQSNPTPTPEETPSPEQTPEGTPIETPEQTPEETPLPEETPEETPVETPEGTETPIPTETPVETPADTPIETPVETPIETQVETPLETPAETPEIPAQTLEPPQETPSETPEPPSETPAQTPETPLETPAETPESTDFPQEVATPTETPELPTATPEPTAEPPIKIPVLATIGDYVWEDTNGNGLQDAGEPPVAGVTVRLFTQDHVLVGAIQTDSTGRYGFAGLPAGGYYLVFDPATLPMDYQFTAINQGDPTLDSDAEPITGVTSLITVSAGETDLTWDAGLVKIIGGTNPTNEDETAEPVISGLKPMLWLPFVSN